MTVEEYTRAAATLRRLKHEHKHRRLTRQQYRTLCGQALAGDTVGAEKGLRKILLRGRNVSRKNECFTGNSEWERDQ